jgi:hypothetical protein
MLDVFRQCGIEPEQAPAPGQPTTFYMRPPQGVPPKRVVIHTRHGDQPKFPKQVSVGNGIRFQPAAPTWIDTPPFAAGPFVLIPRDAHRESRWDFDSDAAQGPVQTMNITFLALPDPQVRVYGLSTTLQIDEARDDQGRSLLTTIDPGEVKPRRNHGTSIWEIHAPLMYPQGAHKLALLRGRLNASLVKSYETIDLLDARGKVIAGPRKVAGLSVTVDSFKDDGQGSQLAMTVDRPRQTTDLDAWSAIRPLIVRENLHASDGSGRMYWVRSDIHSLREDRFYGVVLFFQPYFAFRDDPMPAKKPTKITWDAPVEVEEVAVPVEIKDLDLP